MTDEPEDPGRPNNLYEPLSGDHGAHGRFDSQACPTSRQWWLTKNRGWLALVGVGLVGAALLARRRRAEFLQTFGVHV